MPITRTPMIDDDGSGQSGTVVNNLWKQEFYDQIDAALGPASSLPAPGAANNYMRSNGTAWTSHNGVAIPVPFNAADYSAAGGTWTVGAADLIESRYTLIGKTLIWSMYLSWFSGSSIITGSAVTGLNIRYPAGMACACSASAALGQMYNQGIAINAYASFGGGSTAVTINQRTGGYYTPGAVGFMNVFILEVM